MKNWKIPLFKMYYDDNDVKNVTSIIKRGMFWGLSSETIELEKMVSEKIGVKHCVVFNSGTSALHALMIAYGFKKNNEIIVPSFTFIAVANAPLFVNSTPKFAEIEEESYGLDPYETFAKINKNTKAIIPVHYAGKICKINEISKIAKEKKLILIEDAAEALGSKLNNKMAGSFGDSSVLSFAWNKVITSGEGGAAVTNSKEIFEKLLLIRSHGRIDKESYFLSTKSPHYVTLGYNWRISAMTAALAISQLKKLEKLVKMRIKNANYMTGKLSKYNQIITPMEEKNSIHSYMMYTIRLKQGKKFRGRLQNYLIKKGIQAKIIFEPIHLSDFYRKKLKYRKGILPKTEEIADQVLTLPMYPHLKRNEMDFMVESIKEFCEKNKV